MSLASFAVTYTSVYTDSEPERVFWGADEELSDGDYVPSPKEPQSPPAPQDEDEHKPMFIQPHDLDFMPEPIYPKYIPLEDEHVFSAEEQPLPPIDSPTASSPEYVTESDPEEDPEEYEDDEREDGPADYPMDKGDEGDDGDDDDGDSSRDDVDDDDEDDEEEEEEHLAPTNFTIPIPTVELVSPPERIKPAAISLPPEAEIERLLATPTPPPSPLASLSPPFTGERLARCTAPAACLSPPPAPSPLLPSSRCPTHIQALRLASTQALIDAVTVALPSPPLPPPLHMPPPVDRKDDIPETEMLPRKRLCLSTLGFREVRYGIRDTWVDPTKTVPEIAPMTVGEVNTRVTNLFELHKHDTQDLYALLEDAQDSRTHISQRVIVDSQRVDLLMEDRIAHQETIQILEEEAYAARDAWAHSIG
nr:hypothetical protein [Tanacetum cinerariifolium]